MPYHPSVRKEKQAAYVAANRERVYAMQKAWYQTNREKALAQMKARYAKKREEVRAEQQAYYKQNLADVRAKQAEWRRNNPGHEMAKYEQDPAPFIAKSAKRRAAVLQRTVDWDAELTALATLEAADLAVLRERVTNIEWHVDHVVPLQGKRVSGLHVWNNLQVIPAVENIRKSNRFHQGAA